KSVAINAKRAKKDKNEDALGLPQVLAILPSATPSAGAAEFVTTALNFDSIDEHGAALIAAAAAFRQSPDAPVIIRYLSGLLDAGFSRLENGGKFEDFLTTVRFAQIALAAFPEDPAL